MLSHSGFLLLPLNSYLNQNSQRDFLKSNKYIGVSFSFAFYEIARIITIFLMGKRTLQFAKQYLIAVLSMLPFYLFALFVALLYKIV